jgi:ribonuclease VapC
MIIVVDASAILAIYLDEPDAADYEERISKATVSLISPVNYWEVMARIRGRSGERGVGAAERLMKSLGVVVEAVTPTQGLTAVTASARFGKGHPARLNMGDCFAYALSKTTGAPLLFKGQDFPQTDIAAALLTP